MRIRPTWNKRQIACETLSESNGGEFQFLKISKTMRERERVTGVEKKFNVLVPGHFFSLIYCLMTEMLERLRKLQEGLVAFLRLVRNT